MCSSSHPLCHHRSQRASARQSCGRRAKRDPGCVVECQGESVGMVRLVLLRRIAFSLSGCGFCRWACDVCVLVYLFLCTPVCVWALSMYLSMASFRLAACSISLRPRLQRTTSLWKWSSTGCCCTIAMSCCECTWPIAATAACLLCSGVPLGSDPGNCCKWWLDGNGELLRCDAAARRIDHCTATVSISEDSCLRDVQYCTDAQSS